MARNRDALEIQTVKGDVADLLVSCRIALRRVHDQS
jgi:hypothetical protein